MKASTDNRRLWIECAVLAGVSALLTVFMDMLFAPDKTVELFTPHPSGDTPNAAWQKPKPEEKAQSEPARRALDESTAEVDSPEKATRVAERLEELAGNATTAEYEKANQPEKPGTVSDKVAESSWRIEKASHHADPGERVAYGIAQTAKEIASSSGREQVILAEAAQETLNPEQVGEHRHPKQREYLRQAVLKRMKPWGALDAQLFLVVNHLPHNRWLNGFFRFFTYTFKAGIGWYVILALSTLFNSSKGLRAVRSSILPLSVASMLVEYPIKAFFHRRRPFIDFIQAIVIGKKPGSWSFPSGHSASAFAGAWLLSHVFPRQQALFFLLAGLVGFSRIYLGDHYPGDVASGALSGMALSEIVWRVQRAVVVD